MPGHALAESSEPWLADSARPAPPRASPPPPPSVGGGSGGVAPSHPSHAAADPPAGALPSRARGAPAPVRGGVPSGAGRRTKSSASALAAPPPHVGVSMPVKPREVEPASLLPPCAPTPPPALAAPAAAASRNAPLDSAARTPGPPPAGGGEEAAEPFACHCRRAAASLPPTPSPSPSPSSSSSSLLLEDAESLHHMPSAPKSRAAASACE